MRCSVGNRLAQLEGIPYSMECVVCDGLNDAQCCSDKSHIYTLHMDGSEVLRVRCVLRVAVGSSSFVIGCL